MTCLLASCANKQAETPGQPDPALSSSTLINTGWRFFRYPDDAVKDTLIYDVLPPEEEYNDAQDADTKPIEAAQQSQAVDNPVLKPWILPTANKYILDPELHHQRPLGNPGGNFPFVQADFDDADWQALNIPHDWAIAGPFYQGNKVLVSGGMGRLPSVGVGWYRNKISIPNIDQGKKIYLDIEGAMSYAMVWCNGQLVGGWPYGYASFRLDLTPYIKFGAENQLAIRTSNPKDSSRWYPGGGLYRNVWLRKSDPVHIAHWGTFITTPQVSAAQAQVELATTLENTSDSDAQLHIDTQIFLKAKPDTAIASLPSNSLKLPAGSSFTVKQSVAIAEPKLWGPPPTQSPHLYIARTTLKNGDKTLEVHQTTFGIRELNFDADKGLLVNGEHIPIKGVNQHHDLGALGAAFNRRAAQRQLEMLREMGVNAIRVAHNPPATELLELTDAMGFLVVDEIFDVWQRKKAPYDFHLIFTDWSEPDLRAFIRRDRNHPSVILWSLGNEVGEQYTDAAGAKVGKRLHNIAKQEDPTRLTTASMNFAKPEMPFSAVMDVINLNYQGEGIRDAPGYSHLKGIRTKPLYPNFKKQYPNKVIISSENAAAVSSRGEYIFPVSKEISAPVEKNQGGNPNSQHVSAYALYTTPFGASADKVFASLEKHPYVAGGFVWSGWDYLGEPTPYYGARSSYFGVIDLAGFKKNRFYLYQSHWRPEHPMAHILPHWNWPDRLGKTTPVHVFTSGDEAELFLNGESLGRKKKAAYQYRLRWDDVKYRPGELKVIAYKRGQLWAQQSVTTTAEPAVLTLSVDRQNIAADGKDLAFVTVSVRDKNGLVVPNANIPLTFSIQGPGNIVATDNGDPTDFTPFVATQRDSFNGHALAIVGTSNKQTGESKIRVVSAGLTTGELTLNIGE
ncbi:MAG: DUF4982 domain-containing protein [Cellvibrionaceae bacterium]|nr:DUF4982 domain-containing protein [Cellvibrionaceae bacterium]